MYSYFDDCPETGCSHTLTFICWTEQRYAHVVRITTCEQNVMAFDTFLTVNKYVTDRSRFRNGTPSLRTISSRGYATVCATRVRIDSRLGKTASVFFTHGPAALDDRTRCSACNDIVSVVRQYIHRVYFTNTRIVCETPCTYQLRTAVCIIGARRKAFAVYIRRFLNAARGVKTTSRPRSSNRC